MHTHQLNDNIMDQNRVDTYIMCNAQFLPAEKIHYIKERLLTLTDSQWTNIQCMQLKNPTTTILISLFAGPLGIDRFYVGDTGLGIAKLLTCGGFGLWTIIDWFLIMGTTREKNYQMLMTILG